MECGSESEFVIGIGVGISSVEVLLTLARGRRGIRMIFAFCSLRCCKRLCPSFECFSCI